MVAKNYMNYKWTGLLAVYRSRDVEDELGLEETKYDLRGQSSSFCLDDNGFVLRSDPLTITNRDKSTIELTYLPSIDRLLWKELAMRRRLQYSIGG